MTIYKGKRTKSDLLESLVSDGIPNTAKFYANNTLYYKTDDGSEAYQLHDTEIVRLKPDGTIVLNSGGYQTQTTKERINTILTDMLGYHLAPRLYQENHIWYIAPPKQWDNAKMFCDGMIVHPDGTFERTGGGDPEEIQRLHKAINAYAKRFVELHANGEIDKPSGEDCWYCFMVTQNGKPLGEEIKDKGHFESHLEENYYVPSLLFRVIESSPHLSPLVHDWAISRWVDDPPDYGYIADIGKDQLTNTIKKYMREGLGLVR